VGINRFQLSYSGVDLSPFTDVIPFFGFVSHSAAALLFISAYISCFLSDRIPYIGPYCFVFLKNIGVACLYVD